MGNPRSRNSKMELDRNINDISETAFLTLQCHALDAQSPRPLLYDISAIHTLGLLKGHLADSDRVLYKKLFENRVSSSLITHTALRAKKYDSYIRDFLDQFPEAVVVNIGCGLDHRFERVDNGKILFYDLDLPDIMNIKRQIFPEKERYIQISGSVFDFKWMDQIQKDHVILVAEGVFMYCMEQDVRSLFIRLQERLNNPEIVFEVFSSRWMKGWRKRVTEYKLKQELKFGDGASYKFGIPESDVIESWNRGIKLLDDWSYLDSEELNSPMTRLMRRNNAFRKVQWTVHYQLQTIT
jgi:O-methyltransferase involved in polyketide biosynthesis